MRRMRRGLRSRRRRPRQLRRPADAPELSVATPLDVPGQPRLDLDRALEAILFIADEPQGVVHLATAVGPPVAEVQAAIARLVADYDGLGRTADARASRGTGIRRGFELREVGGGWRIYVRAEHDALVTDFVLTQISTRLSQAALETLSVIAYKQPISRVAGRLDPRRERRLGRAHAARPWTRHRAVRPTPRPAPSSTARPSCCSRSSASTRSTSCRTSRRCSTTDRKDSTVTSDEPQRRRARRRPPAEGARRGGRRRAAASSRTTSSRAASR